MGAIIGWRQSLNFQTRSYEILAIMAFDTYEAVQDLNGMGFDERQAAALVGVIRWAVTGEYTSYANWFRKSDEAGICVDSKAGPRAQVK